MLEASHRAFGPRRHQRVQLVECEDDVLPFRGWCDLLRPALRALRNSPADYLVPAIQGARSSATDVCCAATRERRREIGWARDLDDRVLPTPGRDQ